MRNSQGCHTLGHFRDSAGGVIKNQTDWFLGFSTSVLIMRQQTDRIHCWNWKVFSFLLCAHACVRTHVHMGANVWMQVRMHVWRPNINWSCNSGVLFSLCLKMWHSGAADATGPLHFPNTGVKSVHYDAWLFKWLSGIDLRPSCVCVTCSSLTELSIQNPGQVLKVLLTLFVSLTAMLNIGYSENMILLFEFTPPIALRYRS